MGVSQFLNEMKLQFNKLINGIQQSNVVETEGIFAFDIAYLLWSNPINNNKYIYCFYSLHLSLSPESIISSLAQLIAAVPKKNGYIPYDHPAEMYEVLCSCCFEGMLCFSIVFSPTPSSSEYLTTEYIFYHYLYVDGNVVNDQEEILKILSYYRKSFHITDVTHELWYFYYYHWN